MKRRLRAAAIIAAAGAMAATNVAVAHPDHPDHGDGENQISFEEDFPGEGVEQDKQHDSDAGHLPPKQENVELVGKAEVTNPSGDGNDGRIADVAAYGNYAYLNGFRDPTCVDTGVHVVDISDVNNPVEVPGSFMPTHAGSYLGEGVKILPIAGMDVLIHQNETCPNSAAGTRGVGRDQSVGRHRPAGPCPLAKHRGDNTSPLGAGFVNDSHSFDAWTNQFTGQDLRRADRQLRGRRRRHRRHHRPA